MRRMRGPVRVHGINHADGKEFLALLGLIILPTPALTASKTEQTKPFLSRWRSVGGLFATNEANSGSLLDRLRSEQTKPVVKMAEHDSIGCRELIKRSNSGRQAGGRQRPSVRDLTKQSHFAVSL